ncbi:MAG TPA: hypothetical protein VKG64_04980, partial [Methylomirabilota bacterium]|nr:hypothetical protein [Methylomirabilota bacterium]
TLGTVGYQYDALGRRTRLDVPGVVPTTYAYDAASRLTQILQGTQAVGLQYDDAGRRTLLTLPNGLNTEYQYDVASPLTALIYRNDAGDLGSLTYGYDAAGNRFRVAGSFARTLLPNAVASAVYDAANRQRVFGDAQMTSDANGNLTALTDPTQANDLHLGRARPTSRHRDSGHARDICVRLRSTTGQDGEWRADSVPLRRCRHCPAARVTRDDELSAIARSRRDA